MTMHYRILSTVVALAVFTAAGLTHAQENRSPVKQVGFTQYTTDCASCQPVPMYDPCCPTRTCGCGGCRTIVGEMLCDIKTGARRIVDFARCPPPLLPRCCPTPACGVCGPCDGCCAPRTICIPIPRLSCLLPRLCDPCGCPDCCDPCGCPGCETGEVISGGSEEIIHERVVPDSNPIDKPSIRVPKEKENDPFRDDETPSPVTRRVAPRQLQTARVPTPAAAPVRDDLKSIVKRTSHDEPIAPAVLRPLPQPLPPAAPPVSRPYVTTARFSSGDQPTNGRSSSNTLRFKDQ